MKSDFFVVDRSFLQELAFAFLDSFEYHARFGGRVSANFSYDQYLFLTDVLCRDDVQEGFFPFLSSAFRYDADRFFLVMKKE